MKKSLFFLALIVFFFSCAGTEGPVGPAGEDGADGINGLDGADGLQISSIWEFHTDTYVGQPDIMAEAAGDFVKIGNIQLTIFSNGSSYVSVSGYFNTTTSTNTIFIYPPWSYAFFSKPSGGEIITIRKFAIFANCRIRFKHNPNLATPTFKAVVDVDGNWADNTDESFTLIEQ